MTPTTPPISLNDFIEEKAEILPDYLDDGKRLFTGKVPFTEVQWRNECLDFLRAALRACAELTWDQCSGLSDLGGQRLENIERAAWLGTKSGEDLTGQS